MALIVKEILKAIEISKLDEWKDEVLDGSFNYDDFKKGLIWFSKNMYCEGCKNGGGIKDCQIRKCVISKGLNSCLDCELRNNCKLYSEIS